MYVRLRGGRRFTVFVAAAHARGDEITALVEAIAADWPEYPNNDTEV